MLNYLKYILYILESEKHLVQELPRDFRSSKKSFNGRNTTGECSVSASSTDNDKQPSSGLNKSHLKAVFCYFNMSNEQFYSRQFKNLSIQDENDVDENFPYTVHQKVYVVEGTSTKIKVWLPAGTTGRPPKILIRSMFLLSTFPIFLRNNPIRPCPISISVIQGLLSLCTHIP